VLLSGPELQATFPATAAGVRELRRAVVEVAKRAGMLRDGVDAARLAASEAASNAVLHAYRDEPGPLRLDAWLEDSELRIVITDHGDGLMPRPDSPGLGLGLPIMAQLSDRFEIVSGPEGTEIHLAFRRYPEAA
jgi:anti-sigma regulatory factor (Ser/Thr protein kinase)